MTVVPADLTEAARLWRGRNRYGLTVRPAQLIAGCVYMVLGIIGFVILRPATLASIHALTSAVFFVLGAISALQGIGRLDFQPRPLAYGTLSIDDASLTLTNERGMQHIVPWRAVKSVERTRDALVFVLTWRRAVVVPAIAVGARLNELWPQLYSHLVSRRGLAATPPEHINEIVNTALT